MLITAGQLKGPPAVFPKTVLHHTLIRLGTAERQIQAPTLVVGAEEEAYRQATERHEAPSQAGDRPFTAEAGAQFHVQSGAKEGSERKKMRLA